MRRVCVHCGLMFGLKEPLSDDSETHGYCPECFPLEMEKINKRVEELREIGFLKPKPN